MREWFFGRDSTLSGTRRTCRNWLGGWPIRKYFRAVFSSMPALAAALADVRSVLRSLISLLYCWSVTVAPPALLKYGYSRLGCQRAGKNCRHAGILTCRLTLIEKLKNFSRRLRKLALNVGNVGSRPATGVKRLGKETTELEMEQLIADLLFRRYEYF